MTQNKTRQLIDFILNLLTCDVVLSLPIEADVWEKKKKKKNFFLDRSRTRG